MTFETQRLIPQGPTEPLAAPTPMEMLSRALMGGLMGNAAPEMLEKLFALQERWEKNEARKAFDKAIAQAKAELPIIVKNREVSFGAGRTSYKHEDLAEIAKTIVPVLSKYGLSYRWRTNVTDKAIVVTCIVSHDGGHSEETNLPAPADTSGSKNAIQAIGSTVTYLQRYTLKAALGLAAAKDDDGMAAGGNGKPAETIDDKQKPAETIDDKQYAEIAKAIEGGGRTLEWFCKFAHINALDDLAPERFDAALAYVKKLPKVDNAAGQ